LATENDSGEYLYADVVSDMLTCSEKAGPLMPRALQLQFTRLGEAKTVEMQQDSFAMHGRMQC
jgi:hypothetical protein